jgi:hypothetical protein
MTRPLSALSALDHRDYLKAGRMLMGRDYAIRICKFCDCAARLRRGVSTALQ